MRAIQIGTIDILKSELKISPHQHGITFPTSFTRCSRHYKSLKKTSFQSWEKEKKERRRKEEKKKKEKRIEKHTARERGGHGWGYVYSTQWLESIAKHNIESLGAELKMLFGKCERLYEENRGLYEENKGLYEENKGLTERIIAVKEEEERKLLTAQIARNDAQIAGNNAQIADNRAQIADNRAQIARNDAQIALFEEEIRLRRRMESLSLNDTDEQQVEEYEIKSMAASDYCASKDLVFGPCCLTSSVCLNCAVPACVERVIRAEAQLQDVQEARKAILDGLAQLPYSCHKVSETKIGVTVDQVTGGALEAFFVNRSAPNLVWLRSTHVSKVTMGTYAPHGFASPGSQPDGVCCTLSERVPLAILELKDTAWDPFEAFGQAVAEGSNCVLRQLNCGLRWDQCRLLFVCCNGTKYLFGFVALLEPHFIHAGPLSSVLDVTHPLAIDEVARLLAAIRRSCVEQQQLIQTVTPPLVEAKKFRLSGQRYHRKPADRIVLQHAQRDYAVGWCRFLHIHDQIFACIPMREHVVFPLGFSKDKDGKLDGVLFPRLDNSWSIGLPEDDAVLSLFVAELTRVLTVLHQQVLFVHGDCCPCNIAWKLNDEKRAVRVKLLDLDTAFDIGERLPDALLASKTTLGKEYCYHSSPGKCSPFAVAETDLWYCFLFSRTPGESRVSCAVNAPGGPTTVNGPFRTWVASNVVQLREDFEKWRLSNT